jgi:hypothetical protein
VLFGFNKEGGYYNATTEKLYLKNLNLYEEKSP